MKLVVNLLPPSIRRRQLLRRRAVQWGVVLGVVLAATWCGHGYEQLKYRALRERLEAAVREARPAQEMLREITSMRKQIDDLQVYEAVAHELDHQRQVLPVLGLVSRAARFSDGKLRVLELNCDELQAISVSEADREARALPGAIKLQGVALDSPAVAEFHDNLVRSGMFADVKLIKSNERKTGSLALYDYEVSCEL